MMKDLLDDVPEAKEMLATAKRILGYDLLDIMLNGPEEKLAQTKYCQPAMYIAGLAAAEKLRQDNASAVERCQAVAGLSLGEYAALQIAGVFDFETGLQLVKARAEAMEHETTKPGAKPQSMLSVAGLAEDTVSQLCSEVATGGQVCQIANYLFPKGFSVAGDAAAVEALMPKVENAGALQAKMLKTSGAFHTPIMAPAREKLLRALEEAKPSMQPPRCKVYMNVTSNAIDSTTSVDEIVKLLGDQLTCGVLWEKCMRNAIADGATEFYECGPNKQLKAMMKRINPDMVQKMYNILA
jgi:[acyl-carrier-protein] S-malonyltransferase